MDLKEWLLTQKDIDLARLAVRMWPCNKSAASYLSRKLRGSDGRSWSAKDNEAARKALHELGHELLKL